MARAQCRSQVAQCSLVHAMICPTRYNHPYCSLPARLKTVLPVILLSCVAGLLAGCNSLLTRPGINVAAVPDWVQVPVIGKPDRVRTTVFDPDDGVIQLTSAANETLGFQLVLSGELFDLTGVRVWADDLVLLDAPDPQDDANRIDADQFSFYRGIYHRIQRYGSWHVRTGQPLTVDRVADALVPIAARQRTRDFSVAQGENGLVWVDLHIPNDTPAGLYAGTIYIDADVQLSRSIPVMIQVWDFALPPQGELHVIAFADVHELLSAQFPSLSDNSSLTAIAYGQPLHDRAMAYLDSCFTLARDHGMIVGVRGVGGTYSLRADGQAEVGFEQYDAIVGRYLDGSIFEDGMSPPVYPLPFDIDEPAPQMLGGRQSDTYSRAVRRGMEEFDKHIRNRQWPAQFIFLPSTADRIDRQYADGVHTLAELVQLSEIDAQTAGPLPPYSMEPYGWPEYPHIDNADALADIWALRPDLFAPARMIPLRREGTPIWFTAGAASAGFTGSTRIGDDLVGSLVYGWIAARYGCGGMVLSNLSGWPVGEPMSLSVDHLDDRANGSSWYTYPGREVGRNELLPSIRLKLLRRGIQDYAYVRLLADRGHRRTTLLVTQSLVHHALLDSAVDNYRDVRSDGWVRQGDLYDHARAILARQIMVADRPDTAADDEMASLEDRIDWQQFLDRTRGVSIEIESARIGTVRSEADEQAPQTYLEITATVWNQRIEPLSGVVRFADLPHNWQAVSTDQAVEQVRYARPQTVRLEARCDSLDADDSGVLLVPIEFVADTPTADRYITYARVCATVANTLDQPFVVDGQLDDWEQAQPLTMGSFVQFGSTSMSARGTEAPWPTRAGVATDGKSLFVAIRCFDASTDDLVEPHTNRLVYDGLNAWGEDLVEVVICPARTRESDVMGAQSGRQSFGPGNLQCLVIKPSGIVNTWQGMPPQVHVAPSLYWPTSAVVATAREDDHWTVELSIPLEDLGVDGDAMGRWWALNIARHHGRLSVSSSWSGTPRHVYNPRVLGNVFVPAVTGQHGWTMPRGPSVRLQRYTTAGSADSQ